MKRLLKAVVLATLLVELIGAAALFVQFRTEFPVRQAAFQAIFHSVSAFCNAGFSLFSNNLENYSSNYYVIAIVSALIILGGLGFVVIAELYDRARRQNRRFSLHAKLCLTVTGFLLVGGTILFMAAEYGSVLGRMGFGKSLANAFFQAVTCRTAGFNTVPQTDLTEVAILITIILMFIGACPGSTGGGVKTTSFSIILLLVYNRFLGRRSVSAFKRSISDDSIVRAVTVFLLAILVIVVAFVLLMFAQDKDVAHRLSHGWFVDNFFEVVSAFGTVGLSLGVTPHLNSLSKLVLVALMFAGRVGLLTLAFALSRPPKQGEIIYSEENVMVG
jgi:trk system potassium uptake protein TrkH